MKKGIALSEMLMTIAVIAVITAVGLVVYRTVLFSLSLNNEAELLHHYIKKAQTTAEVYGRTIKWEVREDKYVIVDEEDDIVLREKIIPGHINIEQTTSVVFREQIRPEQGRTIILRSGNNQRKITIDPSTGRVRLW